MLNGFSPANARPRTAGLGSNEARGVPPWTAIMKRTMAPSGARLRANICPRKRRLF
jgi:hypothetical protein